MYQITTTYQFAGARSPPHARSHVPDHEHIPDHMCQITTTSHMPHDHHHHVTLTTGELQSSNSMHLQKHEPQPPPKLGKNGTAYRKKRVAFQNNPATHSPYVQTLMVAVAPPSCCQGHRLGSQASSGEALPAGTNLSPGGRRCLDISGVCSMHHLI